MSTRKEKVENIIKELGAQFLEKENDRTSLLTVTSSSVSPDLKRATIFITVLPESKENSALSFAKRKRGELRDYLKKNLNCYFFWPKTPTKFSAAMIYCKTSGARMYMY